MKKFLALTLALCMVLCLLAGCGEKTDTNTNSSNNANTNTSTTPNTNTNTNTDANPSDGDTTGEAAGRVGYYDDPVDHFARDTYDFAYVYTGTSALTDAYVSAWARMESKYNFTLRQVTGESNQEAYIQNLEVAIDDGVDGIILDCDPTINKRVYEILEDSGVPYVAILNPITDENGSNLAPCVMLDNYSAAYDSVVYYAESVKDYWGDVKLDSNIGLLNMGWSTSPPFVARTNGANDAFLKYFPNGRIVEADGVSVGRLNAEAGYNLASQFITANPDIEYWIVFACMEDYAQGTARFTETTDKMENFLITNVGNQLLPKEFAAGYRGNWYCSYGVPNVAYAGPALCGLIAIADGRATEDTLWQEVRMEGDARTKLYADPVMVTVDNYETFLDDVFALYVKE